jgi:uncharacterized delta-60 repeat protein
MPRTGRRRLVRTTAAAGLLPGLLALQLAVAPAVSADPGRLDPAFGTDGITRAEAGGNAVVGARALGVLPDGKVVTASVVLADGSGPDEWLVQRFLPDGEVDLDFGDGLGHVRWELPPEAVNNAVIDLQVMPDGSVVVAGNSVFSAGVGAVYVERFDSTGGTDDGFGGTGAVTIQPSGGAFGGELALQDGKLLVGYWAEGTNRLFVTRLLDDGSTDGDFGSDGVASADFGVRAVLQDVEVDRDGSVLASGHVRDAGPQGLVGDNAGVARWNADGTTDTAFGAPGTPGRVSFDVEPGADDHASALAVRSDGTLVVAGSSFGADGTTAYLTELRPDGSAGDGPFSGPTVFDASATSATGNDVVVDADDRAYLVGSSSGVPTGAGIRRFDGVTPDGVFGSQVLDCPSTQGQAVALDTEGRALLASACDGTEQVVARYLTAPDVPALADAGLSVTPSTAAAQALALPISALDRGRFSTPLNSSPLNSSPLNSSPLNSSPLNSSPLNSSPLNSSPLNSSPLNSSPLNSSSFPPTLLSEIPLDLPGGWESVLAGTALAGIPDNARTIQQVFALDPEPARLAELTLAHLPLNSSPLGGASIAATLYGNTPLVGVGTPEAQAQSGASARDRWCLFLAPLPFDCTNGADPLVTPLWALELKGDDLSAFYRQDITVFAGQPDPGSPLVNLTLANLETSVTPLGSITHAQAPELFRCPPAGCQGTETLADAQADQELPDVAPTARLRDVRTTSQGQSLRLSELIVGLIPAADFPWEAIDLDLLFAEAGYSGPSVQYRLDVTIDCARSNGLVLLFDLPDGARYVPGSFALDFGEGSYNAPVVESGLPPLFPPGGGSFFGDPTETDSGELRWAAPGSPACSGPPGGGPVEASATLQALTPPSLGVRDASASVDVADTEPLRATGAALTTVDGPETDNDTFETADPIADDTLYTAFVSRDDDVDVWKFTAPAAGSVVTLYGSHLPVDIDLGVFGPRLSDSRSAPLNSSPLNSSPLNSSPLNSSPLEDQGGDAGQGGLDVAPDGLQDSPLNSSPLNSSPLNSSPLNSSPLRASGVQRGLTDEVVTLTVTEEDAGKTFYVAAAAFNQADDPEPYLLRMKTDAAAPDRHCVTRSFGTTGTAGADVSVPADRETLFLVNQKRFGDAYGAARTADMMSKLRSLAALPEVKGTVLPVESNAGVAAAYAAWDGDVCSVAKANAVVEALTRLVDAKRAGVTGLRHLVLVGSDEMLPFFRVPDLVTLSNQKDYAEPASLGGYDNPLSRAFRRGYVITDDKIGDFDPVPWLGSQLYVPDVGVGRVVESPDEIIKQADRVLGTPIAPAMRSVDVTTSSFVAGYDFLRDGATEIDGTLRKRAPGGPASAISETWTAATVKTALDANPRVSSVLAHYDHYRALPAANNLDANAPTPLFNASDLRSSALTPGALTFTLGCQSGLNIADTLVTLDPGEAVKEADWAQVATGEKLLTYLANTGFGYGDTEVVAYSERLFGDFAKGLDGTATVGQAFALAKHKYVANLAVVGVYDHKLLSEATMYGWPFLRVGSTGALAPSFVPTPAPAAPATPTVRTQAFDESMTFERVDTARGTYFREPGQSLITEHFRPIEPLHSIDVTPTDGFKVNGVWFDRVSFRDVGGAGGLDPHLSVPTEDLAASSPEPALGDVAFPAALSNLSTTATATGRRTTLMLLTGQSATTDDLPPGRVVQRLFTRLAGEVARTDGNDFTPPQLRGITGAVIGSTAVFRAEVLGGDVRRARVFYTDDTTVPGTDGSTTYKTLDLASTDGRTWTGAAVLPAGATRVTQYWVAAQKLSGATSLSLNKVFYYTAEQQPATQAAGLELAVSPAPVGGITTAAPTVTVTPAAGSTATFERRVDGGPFVPYTGPFTVTGEGYHRVEVRGSDGSSGTASLVVDTAAPAVTVTTPREGQVFTVGQVVTPQFSCLDAGSGIASCTALDPSPLRTTEGSHVFRVRAVDNTGKVTTLTRTYTVGRYSFEGFFAPVDNPGVFNKTTPGSNVPVKFRVRDRATGAVVSNLSAVTSIAVSTITCDPNATVDAIEELDLSLTSSQLRYDAASTRFHYNWKTTKTWTGCRKLTVTLDDGSSRFALFDFRK